MLSLGLSITGATSWNRRAAAPTAVVHIVAIIGQSNDAGSNDGVDTDPAEFAPDPRILQISGRAADGDALFQAQERLSFPNVDPQSLARGYGMPFAKALLEQVGPEDRVVLVPCAVGGSSYIGTPRWNVGGDLYLNAIARVNAAKTAVAAAYPGYAQKFIWVSAPGENDSNSTAGQNWLETAVASYEGLMNDTGTAGSPVVIPLMSPRWVNGSNGAPAIDSMRYRLRERLPRCAVVESPDGPYETGSGDGIHFGVPAQVVRGKQLAAAVPLAQARSAVFDIQADWLDPVAAPLAGAWSFWRRLRAGYSGPAFRLRRNQDDAEQDFGFMADGLIDFQAVNNFVAGSSAGYVVVLYDQSGLGRDFVQNGTATPPQATVGGGFGWMYWRGGRPGFGANNGSLIAPFELNPGGYALISGHIKNAANKSLLSSQSLQVSSDASGGFRCMPYTGGADLAGFTIEDGSQTLLLSADPTAPGVRVNGADKLLSSTDSNHATYAGATTLLARQRSSGGLINQYSTCRVSELVMWSTRPDVGQVDAATVAQYLPDMLL